MNRDFYEIKLMLAIDILCEGSKKVDNLKCQYSNGVFSMEFNNGNEKRSVQYTFDELKSSIDLSSGDAYKIKDEIITFAGSNLRSEYIEEKSSEIADKLNLAKKLLESLGD
jgi:hypothetical protein